MIGNYMASRLTLHLAEQLLNGEALSKKELAIELNIPYRALLRLYNGKQSENDVITIMSGIAMYCLRKRIPPHTLFHGFAPR